MLEAGAAGHDRALAGVEVALVREGGDADDDVAELGQESSEMVMQATRPPRSRAFLATLRTQEVVPEPEAQISRSPSWNAGVVVSPTT